MPPSIAWQKHGGETHPGVRGGRLQVHGVQPLPWLTNHHHHPQNHHHPAAKNTTDIAVGRGVGCTHFRLVVDVTFETALDTVFDAGCLCLYLTGFHRKLLNLAGELVLNVFV